MVQYYFGSDQHVKKSDIKRRAILDTAYRLFRAQGFDKTSIAEITALVGGSKAQLANLSPVRHVKLNCTNRFC